MHALVLRLRGDDDARAVSVTRMGDHRESKLGGRLKALHGQRKTRFSKRERRHKLGVCDALSEVCMGRVSSGLGW